MALLYISSVVPDEKEFHNPAFTRSGNNVLKGIADALHKYTKCDMISYLPTPSFPRGKFWIKSRMVVLESGASVFITPTLNVKILKNIFEGIYTFLYVLKWAKKHKHEDNKVLVYNIYDPPISFLYKACKLVDAKLYAILYDLGMPPKRLGLSRATMMAYAISERSAEKYIPRMDGRIVINESIVHHYAPGLDYLLVDGGINENVISSLFPLTETPGDIYTFVCAGMLWDQNGTKLIMDAMKINTNPNIRVVFAGRGNDVCLIEEATKTDGRIKYVGMLTMEELFKVYENSDVLMNLRIEEEVDFHFPSKLLEYLATGKCVISTPIAHAQRDYGQYLKVLEDITPESLSNLMNLITSMSKLNLCEKGHEQRKFMIEKRNWDYRTLEILKYMQL